MMQTLRRFALVFLLLFVWVNGNELEIRCVACMVTKQTVTTKETFNLASPSSVFTFHNTPSLRPDRPDFRQLRIFTC